MTKATILICFLFLSICVCQAQDEQAQDTVSRPAQAPTTSTPAQAPTTSTPAQAPTVRTPAQEEVSDTSKPKEVIEFINPRIFTDFVGLEGSQPNGVIQTEVTTSIRLVDIRLTNTQSDFKVVFMHNVLPYVRLSRLNNKVRPLPVKVDNVNLIDGQSVKFAHIIDLLQYAHINTGGKLNIFYLNWYQKKLIVYLDWDFKIYVTTLSYERDVKGNKQKDDFNGLVFGHGPAIKISAIPNNFKGELQADFSLVWLESVNLYDGEFKANFGPYYRLPENKDYNTYHNINKRRWVFIPQFDFIYKPKDKTTTKYTGNEYFFRTTLTVGDVLDKNFFQVQVGYSRNLTFRKP